MSGHVLSRMGSYETSQELNADTPLIFVVEDDTDIARLICHHLNTAGYATRRFAGSATVVDEAKKTPPALFLLDIMIPGSDGFELCRQIRQNKLLAGAYIIFLTAKAGEVDRVRGLELGGDDYITKPFSIRELLARVRAVLRSGDGGSEPRPSQFGNIEIDVSSMTVRVGGTLISTTLREFSLLDYLARHSSRVFTRDQLLDAVWSPGAFVTQRSVDVYVRRLREKIEADPDNPRYLKTVRGIGYRFDIPK
ncbi:MAG TPA: response regulator transcription factor [Terriglobales bacterium]|nr:response regulator transcription factor [Terriglobales bacterium]